MDKKQGTRCKRKDRQTKVIKIDRNFDLKLTSIGQEWTKIENKLG